MRSAVVLASCAWIAACGPREMRSSSSSTAPKIVVSIVIDQLPTWAFERDKALFTGGLARLVREGGHVRASVLPYANSFTAPGHATVGTGVTPSEHGIIGNTWYHRSEDKELSAEFDSAAPVFDVASDGGGEVVDSGASPRALRVDGVADALLAAQPDAHAVTIALKARAAVFMSGKKPEIAVWFDPRAGGMTTSRAYAKALPPWLAKLAREKPASRFVGQAWDLADRALVARVTKIGDDERGEGDVEGLGRAFPHPVRDLEALAYTPHGDRLVYDAVLAALDALPLGRDDVPDLLSISFNAHDYVGHVFGPDSWEVVDLTLRLDRLLGELFGELDRRFGADGWAAVLTSDHGATPLVERAQVAGSIRVRPAAVIEDVNKALVPLLGEGAWVERIAANQVYLSDAIGLDVREQAITLAQAAIERMPKIAQVFRVDRTRGECARRQGMEKAVCLGLAPDISGDLYIVTEEGSLLHGGDHGTHHNAPYAENRHVPVLVRARGVPPGSVLAESVSTQVASTVAALLGVPPPKTAVAPPLFGLSAR